MPQSRVADCGVGQGCRRTWETEKSRCPRESEDKFPGAAAFWLRMLLTL